MVERSNANLERIRARMVEEEEKEAANADNKMLAGARAKSAELVKMQAAMQATFDDVTEQRSQTTSERYTAPMDE